MSLEKLKSRFATLADQGATPEDWRELAVMVTQVEQQVVRLEFKFSRASKDKLISNSLLRQTSDDLNAALHKAEEANQKLRQSEAEARKLATQRLTRSSSLWAGTSIASANGAPFSAVPISRSPDPESGLSRFGLVTGSRFAAVTSVNSRTNGRVTTRNTAPNNVKRRCAIATNACPYNS